MAKNIQIKPSPPSEKPFILFVNTPAPSIRMVVEDNGTISFSSATSSQIVQINNTTVDLKGSYAKFNKGIKFKGV